MSQQKAYVKFDLRGLPCKDIKGTKGLCEDAKGNMVGKKNGVYFRFDKLQVVAFGPIQEGRGLTPREVDETVSSVVGCKVCGVVVLQIYYTRLLKINTSVQLALLHHRLARQPPVGLIESVLDFQICDKLVLKLAPYRDGFSATFRIDCSGAVEILCDARRCSNTLCGEDFRRRCATILKIIDA